MTNSERQPKACTSTPPTLGPTAAANAPAALHSATEVPRRSAGVSASRMASEAGIIVAAKAPWTARAASSTGTLGATRADERERGEPADADAVQRAPADHVGQPPGGGEQRGEQWSRRR